MSNLGRVISRALGWTVMRFGFGLVVAAVVLVGIGGPTWSTTRPLVAVADQLKPQFPVQSKETMPAATGPTMVGEEPQPPMVFGDDARLDELWLACEAGSGLACEHLFAQSPIGSQYERFGVSCGERPTVLYCQAELDEHHGVLVRAWSVAGSEARVAVDDPSRTVS